MGVCWDAQVSRYMGAQMPRCLVARVARLFGCCWLAQAVSGESGKNLSFVEKEVSVVGRLRLQSEEWWLLGVFLCVSFVAHRSVDWTPREVVTE